MVTPTLVVTEINLFPVRSCAGIPLQTASVTPQGLTFDRSWRLATPDGHFLTQRDCPQMALLQPTLQNSRLSLRFNQKSHSPVGADNTSICARATSDTTHGIDQGDEVAEWLGNVLGIKARLLRVTSNALELRGGDFTRPNMSPVLVISEESLADLNARLAEPVRMNRFRPNIVVRGGHPYAEEQWDAVTINGLVYEASTELCGRCPMINVDQERGARSGKDPLKMLSTYKRVPGAVIFGKYLVPQNAGSINVGDELSL